MSSCPLAILLEETLWRGFVVIVIIIIHTFIYNSTELDSHIQCIQAYKVLGNKMRCNVIHTNSISFISNNILTYIKCHFNRNYCQWYSPHGISELRYLFVRISGNNNNNKHIYLQLQRVGFTYTVHTRIYNTRQWNATQRDTQRDTYKGYIFH